MTITAESTLTRILLNLEGNNSPFILERLFYKDEYWKVYTNSGFVIPEESTEPLELNSGDFVDSFDLQNGLYQYRIHSASIENPDETTQDFVEHLHKTLNTLFDPQMTFCQTENTDICKYCDFKQICTTKSRK